MRVGSLSIRPLGALYHAETHSTLRLVGCAAALRQQLLHRVPVRGSTPGPARCPVQQSRSVQTMSPGTGTGVSAILHSCPPMRAESALLGWGLSMGPSRCFPAEWSSSPWTGPPQAMLRGRGVVLLPQLMLGALPRLDARLLALLLSELLSLTAVRRAGLLIARVG